VSIVGSVSWEKKHLFDIDRKDSGRRELEEVPARLGFRSVLLLLFLLPCFSAALSFTSLIRTHDAIRTLDHRIC
jgi:hypothetical protein